MSYWEPMVVAGADLPEEAPRGTKARVSYSEQHTPEGPFLHAWVKFRLPSSPKVYLFQLRVNLREVEAHVNQVLAQRLPQGAAAGGRIARKMREGIKHAVNKVAKSKIVKGVITLARKVAQNPLVKGLLSATPMGAAMYATAAAARVAAKAIKGSHKAKSALRGIAARAKRGDPDAIKTARLVKAGVKMTGIAPTLQMAPQAAAAGEGEYLAAVCGACCDGTSRYAQGVPYAVSGMDTSDDQDVDALETVATSGAFEGVRWLAHRLSMHGMLNNPNELGTRQLLMLGQQVIEQQNLRH